MPPRSQLSIQTSSLQRLIKEEASYHKEQTQQEARLAKLESETGDENKEYLLKQEKTAIEETKKVFPELHKKIQSAVATLMEHVNRGDGDEAELEKAREAIASARESGVELSA